MGYETHLHDTSLVRDTLTQDIPRKARWLSGILGDIAIERHDYLHVGPGASPFRNV